MAKPSNGREMRLEVLRVAANIVCQLKDPKLSAIETAKQMLAFVDGEEYAGPRKNRHDYEDDVAKWLAQDLDPDTRFHIKTVEVRRLVNRLMTAEGVHHDLPS